MSRQQLGLAPAEFALLQRLTNPPAIQAYLNTIPINYELDGETIHSVRSVIRQRRAHCIEGAMFAACALWVQGQPPLLMHLDCASSDWPHVVALFRDGRGWGAISKTNGAALRYRDPIYRSLRELALSYFHEYTDRKGEKTLRSYSGAFDLRRLGAEQWVTNGANCQQVEDTLSAARHYPLLSTRQQRLLTRLDSFQRKAARVVQFPRTLAR